ncbi:MAG: hypothetical protein EOM17_12790 [Synergistales bacterium]|nr:hypothetical protein [Synergistales bacterium]
MENLKAIQNRHGALPAYAWPGGYTIVYVTKKDEVLCAQCATHLRKTVAWYGTLDEGSPEECCLCSRPLFPSYGDPEGERILMAEGHGEREAEIMMEIYHDSLSLAWEQDRLRQALAWEATEEKVAVLRQRIANMASSLENRQHRLAEVREGREISWSEWQARA